MSYENFLINRFSLWDLYLHQSQFPYLGRCYASAIRPEADLVTDITGDEALELFLKVIPAWAQSVSKLFGEFRPNVSLLGNNWNHLHAHLIPRFTDKRNFYGIDFIDPNPQGNYAPYPKKDISLEVLLKIKEEIQKTIN